MRTSIVSAISLAALAGCSSSSTWLDDAHIAVMGNGVENQDCRSAIGKHNENTDLIVWNGDIWFVHRTAESQTLGPNSALHIYRYTKGTFVQTAQIDAPSDRDIRDPHFYIVGGELRLKALARLPSTLIRDAGTDTVALGTSTTDGTTWSDFSEIGPHTWSFWRPKQSPAGEFLTAAYEDGDLEVMLYRSTDGITFTAGATIYDISAQTPLETELTFMPSGKLMALVRTDGDDDEITGDADVRTVVCWADPPYDSFSCPQTLDGVRLDGPLTFWWNQRLMVIARKHLGADGRKRTALYELGGTLEGGPLTIKEWGELPSAGDTSYAGAAPLQDGSGRMLATWYSGDIAADDTWLLGMFAATDIWQAVIDPSKLK